MSRVRLSAAITIVALTATALLALASTTADAAGHRAHHAHRAFKAPTTHTLTKATCHQVDDNTWNVTYKWQVRGGRYLNLGNGAHFKFRDDNVYRGGRRTVTTGTQINGWGDGPAEAPTSAEATYDQLVAPIGHRANVQQLTDTVTVNLDC